MDAPVVARRSGRQSAGAVVGCQQALSSLPVLSAQPAHDRACGLRAASLDAQHQRSSSSHLGKLGIELFEAAGAGCCGALRYHLNAQEQALDDMRRVIDAWWPHVEGNQSGNVEAIVMTASGCGAHVREYGELLKHDPAYAEKASRISALTLDISQVLAVEQERLVELIQLKGKVGVGESRKLAFHSPCTLQHGQKIRGVVESLLVAAGYELTMVADSHFCCGSAGTYSITQPELSGRLRKNKLAALGAGSAEVFVTANIGCQTHLQSGTATPVRHWIELIDERLGD